MPAILVGETLQRNEQMWQALKNHIMRERQRKKQEQEADEEEERLRKEREHQQKRDVMTLGETRDQLSSLQEELSKLHKDKRDLFTELKRVLLEEENRKRQHVKENSICSKVLTVGGYSAMNTKVTHSQLFLPVARSTSPQYEASVVGPQVLTTGSSKRTLSPPPILAIPSYHISYYKPPPCIPNYNLPPPSKSEEPGRRSNDSRAVLWNKNNQYSYYSTTPSLSRCLPTALTR
ncbi:PREDICTED: G protein pathway suppressor 2-like [Dinoponera quadriceps]|uniref:G protein pathway suppressor 2-like n=1 Tax=Dinoponera quadriceps TaxID=609295 RepID=A0A6P3WVI9_DINQU|nr:PREDICTED: G protein pathway suppressor 2-like [Dinoponera quadriceps]XP_014470106.1 PREDICTED: G protein pathway suppressor 2-like [Dinoponera quadriceps]